MNEYKNTLESILQDYFNCKKPFLNNPYYDDKELCPVTMTKRGYEKYGDLVSLLYRIQNLTGIDVNDIIDELDSIASEI